MKNRGLGVFFIVLGILLILTPWIIFPVCGVGRYAPPSGQIVGHHGCHATLKAETIIGGITILAGMLPILWPKRKLVIPVAGFTIVLAVLSALFPTYITGMCKMATMPCNLGTTPAIIIISILMASGGVTGIFLNRKPE
jgi:Domain of unknown function (DUF4418)